MNTQPSLLSRMLLTLGLAVLLLGGAGKDAFAQKNPSGARTLVGTVTAGEPFPGPLPGATVLNTKTKQGVVTDEEGHYSIRVTGPDDIILNGKTGWLFSSPMEMADAVAEDRGSETGKMAHRRVTEFFSWSSMAKAIVGKAEAAGLPAEMKIHKGK